MSPVPFISPVPSPCFWGGFIGGERAQKAHSGSTEWTDGPVGSGPHSTNGRLEGHRSRDRRSDPPDHDGRPSWLTDSGSIPGHFCDCFRFIPRQTTQKHTEQLLGQSNLSCINDHVAATLDFFIFRCSRHLRPNVPMGNHRWISRYQDPAPALEGRYFRR